MLQRQKIEPTILEKLKELESSGIYVVDQRWDGINAHGFIEVMLAFDNRPELADSKLPSKANSNLPGQCEWCKKDDEPDRQSLHDNMVFHHRCWQKYKLKMKNKSGPHKGKRL